jgi:hypothetical protein
MPYVKEGHRKKLDPYIEVISDEIASAAALLEKPQQIGELYFSRFYEISRLLRELAEDDKPTFSSSKTSQQLAKVVFETGMEDRSFWAGDLNYSLTRIIQIVPRKLVEKRRWEKEFRYWTYAVTAGALEKTALALSHPLSSIKNEGQNSSSWLDVVLVGVLLDIKDEYKRRVNAPYEIEQQKINGDCYDVKL